MKMSDIIPLIGLPEDAVIMWNHLHENSEDHICDEDIVWIKLSNGIMIDAGQYGLDPSIFRVDVVPENNGWKPVESSICQTTQEVATEIIRLANKFNVEWYANIAKNW